LTIIIVIDLQKEFIPRGACHSDFRIFKATSNEVAYQQFVYNQSIPCEKFCHPIKFNHVDLVSKVVALLKCEFFSSALGVPSCKIMFIQNQKTS